MSAIALAPQRGLLSYIVGSVTAPRATVRQLMQEPQLKSVGWQLVLIGATVSALSGILSGLYERSYRPDGFQTSFLPPDYPLADIFLWGALEFGLFIGAFLLMKLLWSHLFGYRELANAVWVAAVVSCCFAIFLDPLTTFAISLQGGDAEAMWLIGLLCVYVLIAVLMGAIYFSTALSISYLRAFSFFLCVMVINLIATTVIMLAFMMPSLYWSPANP